MSDISNDSGRHKKSMASGLVIPLEMEPGPRPGALEKDKTSDAAAAPAGVFTESSVKRAGESADHTQVVVPWEMAPGPRPEPSSPEIFISSGLGPRPPEQEDSSASGLGPRPPEQEDYVASGLCASPLLGAFKWWGLFLAGLFIMLFGVFVFFQAIQVLAAVSVFPPWARYAVYGTLGLITTVVLVVLAVMIKTWWRLKTTPRIDLDVLAGLGERSGSRELSRKNGAQARKAVAAYMASFPCGDHAKLRRLGFDEAECRGLAAVKKHLEESSLGHEQWLKAFRDNFQSLLDQAAKRIIRNHGKSSALGTAICPFPLLDAFIVLGTASGMMRQLCLVYNLSPGRFGAWALLGRAFRNAFFGGLIGAASNMAAESLEGILDAESAGNILGGGALMKVIPKAAEGLVTFFFMRRLGETACSLLRIVK